jgi:hypothetical protein
MIIKKAIILALIIILLVSIFSITNVSQTTLAQQTPTNATTTTTDDNFETLVNQAIDLYSSGRYNEAIESLDKALVINPNDPFVASIRNSAVSQLAGAGTNTSQQVQQTQQPPVQQTQQPPVQQTQLQQPPIIQPHEALDSFKANGKINSDIITSSSKWDATGDWNLVVEDNEVQLFTTNMAWNNATSGHSHEFLAFESEDEIVLPPDNIISIEGNMNVGTNGATSWEEVPATIDIGGGGKVITISLDHEETDHHFAGQPISGVVTSLTPCSDQPGPSMEVYPSCS